MSLITRVSQTAVTCVFSFVLGVALAQGQVSTAVPSSGARVAPARALITEPVDESRLTRLRGNTHRLARAQFDLGTASADLPMQRMLLVLKRSPEQEFALRKLLDDQQDKASPDHHRWLTPEQFGKQFGPTDADMQTITAWLQSHGFQVGSTKGRTLLEFSGSASQVQETFHTAIHKYLVNGEQHWANASDPMIPTALTPAVAGIFTLHNFLKKPHIHFSKEPVAAQIVRDSKGKPQVTFPAQSGQPAINALGPQDYATIYNLTPAYNTGTNGLGKTIAVVGRSNLWNLQGQGADVSTFFGVFDLSSQFPNIILNGPDPGDLGGGEEAEATLDTTWSGALAPGANVELVVSATTNTTDGIDLSELYIIENNFADVMTESFGSCEANYTSAQAAAISQLAEQAAAQGISYFVSTGDEGAEGCDDPNFETVASGPVSPNMLASTPFNTAVGGTIFNENNQVSLYWGSSQPVSETALSYIPEDVWNESCTATACGSNANIWAGSGGASTFFPKPSWQYGVTGIPNDNARDLPDVSLTAASHDPYLLCLEGSCIGNSQGQFFIYFVWGTSAAAPSFAGIMAMVDQQMGTRQGLPNYVLYRLAATESAYPAQCNGSNTSGLPKSACTFNDVTVGNNAVPGEINYGLSTAQYQATAGYDLATGIGSVNVANLIANWNSVTFNPTTTTLVLNNNLAVSITHGRSVPVGVTVAPNSGTGVPTGDVTLLAATGPQSQSTMDLFTLAGGQVVSSTSQLPGGTYSVSAHYGGDGTYAPSDSIASSVTVSAEPSTITETVLAYDQSGNPLGLTSIPFGSFVYLRADVAGQSQTGIPTGTVSFTDTFGAIPGGNSFNLNSQGNTATPNGILNFDTGTHTISATYNGDASFQPGTTTQSQTLSVTSGFFAAIPSSGAQMVIAAPGAIGSVSMSVSSSTGFTGTINFACSEGLPAEATCSFSPSSIVANGTSSISSVSITVTTKAAVAMLRPGRRTFVAAVAYSLAGSGLLFSLVLVGAPKRRRASRLLLLLTLALIVVVPGCGGGSSNHVVTPPPDPGTPVGASTVTVTATSGAIVSATQFTVIVQ